MARRFLLSIDGGGIRGVIPATVVRKLEEQTAKPARETFHFLAGTSTGAIITGGLAVGIPAARIREIYLERGPEIFRGSDIVNFIQRIVRGYMYSTQKLHDVLAEEAGDAADWTVGDSPVDLLVSAKAVKDGEPWYFVKDDRRHERKTAGFNLVDCVTASAAAPTYFKPWPIDPIGDLIDGGVGIAGNPVYQAAVEAFDFAEGYTPADTTIVSLGTGRHMGETETPSWILPWIEWLIDELLDSTGEQQTQITQRHFAPPALFYRIDVRLEKSIGMDDVEALDELAEIGEKLAAEVDWNEILAGKPNQYLITPARVDFDEYSQSV
jgi:predicted acylesterase/phospholipase RssA